MASSSHHRPFMPSSAAEQLFQRLPVLMEPLAEENTRLSPTAYQQILFYCGIRPDIAAWRRFLMVFLTQLGLLAIVVGTLFFIAWNWALMPKMAKFALVELLIIALAVVTWWRWYDRAARTALLATGLIFGGLLALYGQVYQTGADNWELFRAWAIILLPLALAGRQNALWFCTWAVANIAFQLYHTHQGIFFYAELMRNDFSFRSTFIVHAYFVTQILCLVAREALTEYAQRRESPSWLLSRWFSRVMATYLLWTLTQLVVAHVLARHSLISITIALWIAVLVTGYFYYRYRRVDLYMLAIGVSSIVVVGFAGIAHLFDDLFDTASLFAACLLMALWLVCGGTLLLRLWYQLHHRPTITLTQKGLTDLLQILEQQQLLSHEQIVALEGNTHVAGLPWYMRIVFAIGSWVAALLSLLCLALLLLVTNTFDLFDDRVLILPSLIIAAFSAMLLRAKGAGKHHIGLVWAITATIGLCISVVQQTTLLWGYSGFISALYCLPIIVIMAVAMRDPMYRFMATTAVVCIVISSLSYIASTSLSPRITLVLIALLVASMQAIWLWVFLRQHHEQSSGNNAFMASLLYGIPTGLVLLSLTSLRVEFIDDFTPIFSIFHHMLGIGIATGLMIGALIQVFAFSSPLTKVHLPAAIVCGAAAILAPGIGLGLMLLLVARHQGSKLLLASAGSFLTLYLITWYYFLGVTLLQKSLLLVSSGAILLGLAFAAKKLLSAEDGDMYAK